MECPCVCDKYLQIFTKTIVSVFDTVFDQGSAEVVFLVLFERTERKQSTFQRKKLIHYKGKTDK